MRLRLRITAPVVLFSLLFWTKAFSEPPSEDEMMDCPCRYLDSFFHKAMIRNSIFEDLIVFGIMVVSGLLLIISIRCIMNFWKKTLVFPRSWWSYLVLLAVSALFAYFWNRIQVAFHSLC